MNVEFFDRVCYYTILVNHFISHEFFNSDFFNSLETEETARPVKAIPKEN